MGLDMYLSKKTYVKVWGHNKKNNVVSVKFGGKKRTDIKPERISYVVEEVMYWRKANHIHKWFVENCQKGVDDCGEYYVSTEQLTELATLCESVVSKVVVEGQGIGGIIRELVENELPTAEGFFFGGTEYDEYYFKMCADTAKVIRELLEVKAEKGTYLGEYYYQSSW